MKSTPKYRRMTKTDRLIIERLYNNGASYRSISTMTGFAVSSLHTEIKHGLYPHLGAETTRRPLHYSADIAQNYADFQATAKGPALKLGHHHSYADFISTQIKAGRSPDQIAGALRKSGRWTVSTTTLYRYIDRGYIPNVTNRNLREKPLRKRTYRHVEAKRPPKGTSIERRPEIVSTRSTFGHWELDSVIGKAKGKRQSLLVLTERMTRYEIILRVPNKTSSATVRALDKLLKKFPNGTFQTITVDNGSEFQDCHGMEHDKNGNKRLTVGLLLPPIYLLRTWEQRTQQPHRPPLLPQGQIPA